jgi:IS5 family transposase
MRKGRGRESRLCFELNALMENRHGLCVDVKVNAATGKSEREAALEMLREIKSAKTLGADKGYDTADFVTGVRSRGVTPHVAAKRSRGAVDGRTTRHESYRTSQRKRKLVEEIFGWMKTVGNFRKTRYRGARRTGLCAEITAAAYNLVRMVKLLGGGLAAT